MAGNTTQEGNTITDGDLVGGNKTVNHFGKKTKLASLFDKLQQEYDQDRKIEKISEDLQRYSDRRDTIGLEEKLKDGNRLHILEDATWLKQEYYKKLTRFQFYEPAQEIHAYILSVVLEKFRNIVYPLLRNGDSEVVICEAISTKIIEPLMKTILEEGCNDIMGLSATDIDGMIYFLTGQCHIKWVKNDSIPSGI